MKVLLATTNKAKLKYFGNPLKEKGIEIVSLSDLNIDYDVDEIEKNPIENAIIKAKDYNKLSNIPTIAIDEGLFLENVDDDIQPGTHVRRVNGKRLDDEEMIEYYIGLVNKYGDAGKLKGYFLKAAAVVDSQNIFTFEFKADRCFTNKKSSVINEGYPLASIQFVPSLNKFKSELSYEEEKLIRGIEQKVIINFLINTIINLEKNKQKELVK